MEERETAIYGLDSRSNTDTQGINSHDGYGVVFGSKGDTSTGTQTDSGLNKGDDKDIVEDDDELSEKKVEMMV